MKKRPLTIIIFGATGGLYQKKLALALFDLFLGGLLPSDFTVFGFARRELTDEMFHLSKKESLLGSRYSFKEEIITNFLEHFKYIQGDFTKPEDFKSLSKKLHELDESKGICSNKLFYLSVVPSYYTLILKNIKNSGLAYPCVGEKPQDHDAWARVLIEKPFGEGLESARDLKVTIDELFDDNQIFNVDHYLAKEAVQNILTFRSSKNLSPIWNNKNIEKVRILFYENHLVGKRGVFYDKVGALRDVGQNHMLQMLAMLTMETIDIENASNFQNSRALILKDLVFLKEEKVLRGQYSGYKEEAGVEGISQTETFFHIELGINNDTWEGVKFELEGGKGLAESHVYIEVYFKQESEREMITINIEPNKDIKSAAYEKVFLDSIRGDKTFFVSINEIMAEWKVTEEIMEFWQDTPLIIYKKRENPLLIK